VGERDFCIFQTVQTAFGAHPTSHSRGTDVVFPAVNSPGHEVDLLPAYSAEGKGVEIYFSLPPRMSSWHEQGKLYVAEAHIPSSLL
jgi:hypothetical protein